MKFSLVEEEIYLNVLLDGDLDIEGTEIIDDDLTPKLLKLKSVNLDFTSVPFVDSTGMGLLISLVQKLKEQNIGITISNVSEEVHEIFELLQLSEILGGEVLGKPTPSKG
ncbi:STAS domain-containing protein [Radiobacillus deserti]|uniref:STAS domain-containing protein n=1 Tax=Radiobacillus deserti TaxID=2594883 RepID=A0A516KL24_9BACI|nr:STAS domain-containing protein [Radiobacillus deserti]